MDATKKTPNEGSTKKITAGKALVIGMCIGATAAFAATGYNFYQAEMLIRSLRKEAPHQIDNAKPDDQKSVPEINTNTNSFPFKGLAPHNRNAVLAALARK